MILNVHSALEATVLGPQSQEALTDCLPRSLWAFPGQGAVLVTNLCPGLNLSGFSVKELVTEGGRERCMDLDSRSQAPPGPHQNPASLQPCPRGTGHLGMGVEQLEQGHDEGLHGDAAPAVLLQVVGHGGTLPLVQQVPSLLRQQHARLVPQAAQCHLGAGWPLVKPKLKDRKTEEF